MSSDLEKTTGASSYRYNDFEKSSLSDKEKSSNALLEDEEKSLDGNYHEETTQRKLKARQISMIAIGGTIGTGLFISTKNILMDAGPVSSIISFLFMTSIAFGVTQGLGEMATYIPATGSFTQFVARWCSPALGAANGWNYWFSWAITFALELSVIGQVIQRWTDKVPLEAWIAIFYVILVGVNLCSVKVFGELEFWISFLKVIAVVGWIIYAFIMVCGAGKTGPVGFRYWRNPGPWGPGILVKNVNTGRFLGFVSSFTQAAFTFQGCELVGLSSGESKNPRKTVPSAIRKVLFRILVFYVLCMAFIGLLVPYNDKKLANDDGSYAASSPFIIAIENSGTKVLPDIFNAVILIAVISAGNSNIYCGSRVVYGLAQSKVAPKIFLRTTRSGVPYVAVIFTSLFGFLAYLSTSDGNAQNAFNWLLNITAVSGLIAWGWISFAHVRFMNILRSRGISRDSLPFKAKFMPVMSYYCVFWVFVISFIQGFEAFFGFNASNFFASYISLIFFAVSYIFFHFLFNGFTKKAFDLRRLLIPLDECDIDSGVRVVEEEEWEAPPKNLWEKLWNIIG